MNVNSRQFTECEWECELKISKTTHSPHQLSQNLSKKSFITSLFYHAQILQLAGKQTFMIKILVRAKLLQKKLFSP
jgi:hypothetical protein